MHGFIIPLCLLAAIGPAKVRAYEGVSLKSNAVLVVDRNSGEPLISKNADVRMPIASLTKLMMALVVVDAHLPMDQILEVTGDDVDGEKHTRSRLAVGTRLSRADLLLLALMSSENRAAMALSRNYPGGRTAFVAQMNATARALSMNSTHFADPAGLSDDSVSTARDLLHLMGAASTQPLIRRDTTHREDTVRVRGRLTKFVNTNRLVRSDSDDWDIELQKTGFTNEAGRCLVMQATTLNRKLSMVFLDSVGKLTRFADAGRVRRQLAAHPNAAKTVATAAATS